MGSLSPSLCGRVVVQLWDVPGNTSRWVSHGPTLPFPVLWFFTSLTTQSLCSPPLISHPPFLKHPVTSVKIEIEFSCMLDTPLCGSMLLIKIWPTVSAWVSGFVYIWCKWPSCFGHFLDRRKMSSGLSSPMTSARWLGFIETIDIWSDVQHFFSS